MAQSLISFFVDDAAVTALDTRMADDNTLGLTALVNSGVFGGAANAPGLGISTENPNLEESLMPNTNASSVLGVGSWSLLDQHGDARESQISQLIGGNGIVAREGNVATTWDKTQLLYTPSGAASSGGLEGTLPDATVRLMDAADLPTAAEKVADPNVDGELTLPAQGANLSVLADGWIIAP
jgi:hypothetical protein